MSPTRLQVPPNSDLTLGMVCITKDIPGESVWTMAADERFTNPAGLIQGGFLAAFCDSAMGAAAVTFAQGRKVFVANTDLAVSFLKPVHPTGTLTCRARVISGGTRVAFVEAQVHTEDATLVTTARSTYVFTERTA